MSRYTLTLDDHREFATSQKYVPDEHQLYYYDELDRLVGVAKSFSDGYNASYTYDKIGNLITKTEPSAISYTYPAPGAARPHAATQAGSNSYTYNANGDMLTRTENSISYTQQWDAENRLKVVTNTTASPNIVTTFFYNGDGARVKKTELKGAVITTTFYAGAIEVLSTTLLITKTYYSAGGQMIAMREVTNTTGAGTLTYLHSDHLGSTSVTTCGNSACGTVGAVLVRQSYYPYGGVRQAGNLPTDHTFTGQLEDDSTGLQFFNARYYSNSLGRFVSADTIVPGAGNPQKFNRYAFVLNNPLKYVDPSGHTSICGVGCDDEDWSPTLSMFGISLGGTWTYEAKLAISAAVISVAEKFSEILGGTLVEAFRAGFGMGSEILELNNDCNYCGHGSAETVSSRRIRFNDLNGSNYDDWFVRGRDHVVHELGHAFNASWVNAFAPNITPKIASPVKAYSPYSQLQKSMNANPNLQRDGSVVDYYGFASLSNVYTWQLHGQGVSAGDNNEIFADQFLGWTFNTWQGSPDALTVSASDRSAWMDSRMPSWIHQMAGVSSE